MTSQNNITDHNSNNELTTGITQPTETISPSDNWDDLDNNDYTPIDYQHLPDTDINTSTEQLTGTYDPPSLTFGTLPNPMNITTSTIDQTIEDPEDQYVQAEYHTPDLFC